MDAMRRRCKHLGSPPNTCYQHAPFLFWVVVSIGSRRYTRQPTLTRALALPVTQLALQSIIVRTKPIERMKRLILLLNWPFPSGPFYRDPSFVLGGTLLHMAMHCGLHAPSLARTFQRHISNYLNRSSYGERRCGRMLSLHTKNIPS
ncbi:hypothetical protein V1507DRAFT_230946 [Lipomyces tetrasporus]